MAVIYYQIFILATLIVARIAAPRKLLLAAMIWSGLTVFNLFYPPLIALQLIVIWGGFWLLKPRRATLVQAKSLAGTSGPGVSIPALWRVSPDDAEWEAHYIRACESPAEVAFLRAMVGAHALLPDRGVLTAAGVALKMQVEVKPYRVDFLCNDWLVIEIDGAAYHSSPEQLASDKARDEYFEEKGYSVLRIAAKVVFREPERAVQTVRSALAVGCRQLQAPQPLTLKPSSSKTPTTVWETITYVNDFADKARAVQTANTDGRNIFSSEKTAIDSSIELALSKLELADCLENVSTEDRTALDGIMMEISAAEAESDAARGEQDTKFTMHIPAISQPPDHPDPAIHDSIQRVHASLMEERSKYFAGVRHRLWADQRLPDLVKANLIEMGCSGTWLAFRKDFAPSRLPPHKNDDTEPPPSSKG